MGNWLSALHRTHSTALISHWILQTCPKTRPTVPQWLSATNSACQDWGTSPSVSVTDCGLYADQLISTSAVCSHPDSYDVQDIRVTQSFINGTACLECVILRHGVDKGCLIRMKQLDQCLCCSPTVLKLVSSPTSAPSMGFITSVTGCTHHIYGGTYSLQASDIGSEHNAIGVQRVVSLKGITCSPTSTSDNGDIKLYHSHECSCCSCCVCTPCCRCGYAYCLSYQNPNTDTWS